MAYVTLILDLYDGAGEPIAGGTVTCTPNVLLTSAADHMTIPQVPVVIRLFNNPLPSVQLLATDSDDIAPTGWGWLIQPDFPGAPAGQVYQIVSTGGTVQYLSELTPATEAPDIITFATSSELSSETTRAEAAEAAAAATAAAAAAAAAGSLAKASNLSDVSNPSTARASLAVPGLATANTLTGDQFFKSGRPWYDVVAFGADPTGTADSTAAIQSAINTALGLRTDTSVGMTGTTVTDAAAVSGDAGKYVNSPNYPLGCSLISSVTPGVGYVVATAATATLSGQVVGIGTGCAVAIRIALGPVFLPRGSYKITADLNIQSSIGFAFRGAGAGATSIVASGAGFSVAALFIDGSQDGVFEGFAVKGIGTEGTAATGAGGGIPAAVRLDWTTAAARSTTANTFRNIRVLSMKYVVGLSLEGNGARQLDGTTMHDIVVTGQQTPGSWSGTGNWQKGIAFGNGTYGNNYDHVLYNCSVALCNFGIHCNASGFELFGSQPGANAVEFFVNAGVQTTINGVQSQGSGQLIVGSGGSGLVPVSVRDVQFYTGALAASGKWVSTTGAGASWLFENIQCYTAGAGGVGGAGVPLMSFNGGGAKESVTLINVQQAAPPSTGITLTSGGSLIAIGYVQMTSVTVPTVGTLFPLYCLNAGALYQQGLASARPAASAFGEMFYYATDTGALSHSNGSAWTANTGAAATAPDVQVFTANGTWTKPSGPAPATTEVVLITPGGGGASGRRGATGTVRCGGGGGGGGEVIRRLFSTADLTSTVAATVPGQQAGGVAITTDDTNGNAGAGFATCSFGAFVTGFGGQGGQGGTNASGLGGASALGTAGVSGAGVSASTVGGPGVLAQLAVFTGPGGPSGGGITSGNVAGAGAAGNGSSLGTVGTSAGGAVDSTAPTAGAGANAKGAVGVSCGSGAASITTAAQQGADAAATAYGAGGAGGGAALNGNNSGAGGKSGGGYILAISYFQ